MPKFLNPWGSELSANKHFTVEYPIYVKGDFAIYKQQDKCYLYTYKDIAINQLAGINKQHIEGLLNKIRPLDSGDGFLYDRAMNQIIKHYPEYK